MVVGGEWQNSKWNVVVKTIFLAKHFAFFCSAAVSSRTVSSSSLKFKTLKFHFSKAFHASVCVYAFCWPLRLI